MAREPFERIWTESPTAPDFDEPTNNMWEEGWRGGADQDPPEAFAQNWWQNRADIALQQIERQGYMEWVSGATYQIGGLALASNGLVYRSQINGNIGNDPILDDGSRWIVEPSGIATQAEAEAKSSLSKIMTPGRLVNSFTGPNQLLSANGFQNLPGGIIVQWGSLKNVALNQTFYSVTLPVEYPSEILGVYPAISMPTTVSGAIAPLIRNLTLSSFDVCGDHTTDPSTGDIYWLSIGF